MGLLIDVSPNALCPGCSHPQHEPGKCKATVNMANLMPEAFRTGRVPVWCTCAHHEHDPAIQEEALPDYITIRYKKRVALIERYTYSKLADSYQVEKVLKVAHKDALSVAGRWAREEGLEIR